MYGNFGSKELYDQRTNLMDIDVRRSLSALYCIVLYVQMSVDH